MQKTSCSINLTYTFICMQVFITQYFCTIINNRWFSVQTMTIVQVHTTVHIGVKCRYYMQDSFRTVSEFVTMICVPCVQNAFLATHDDPEIRLSGWKHLSPIMASYTSPLLLLSQPFNSFCSALCFWKPCLSQSIRPTIGICSIHRHRYACPLVKNETKWKQQVKVGPNWESNSWY